MQKSTIRRLLYAGAAICALYVIGTWILGGNPTPRNVDNGDRIIAALDKYKAGNGAYPPSLNALVPEYLSEVPEAHGRGMKWDYNVRRNNRQFRLTFNSDEPGVIIGNYDSDERVWVLVD